MQLHLEPYIQFLTNLGESSVEHLGDLYDESIDFRDPINSAIGLQQLEAVYLDLFKQLKDITIRVTDHAQGMPASFIHWEMSYLFRKKPRRIDGITMVRHNESGKIIQQRDYWDASHGVYGEFPLMGISMKAIHKLVRIKHKV